MHFRREEIIKSIIIHQLFSLARDWSKRVTWANIHQLKLGNIRGYSPIVKTNGHYLFLEAHSFPRASLSEKCSLLGTDNVRGQISEHILAPNEGYCLYIIYLSTNHMNLLHWTLQLKFCVTGTSRTCMLINLCNVREKTSPVIINTNNQTCNNVLGKNTMTYSLFILETSNINLSQPCDYVFF